MNIERPLATVFFVSIPCRLEPVGTGDAGEIFVCVNAPGKNLPHRLASRVELLPSIRLSCGIDDFAYCNLLLKMGLGCSLH